jgi:hypothetical protein
MKNSILVLIVGFILYINTGHAQSVAISFKVKADTVRTYKYVFKGLGKNQIYLQMSYGGTKIFNPATIKKIKKRRVSKIELIYTAYPKGADIQVLNKQRLASLYTLYPELFELGSVEWKFVEQTYAKNEKQAVNMFHGFAITYIPGSSRDLMLSDVNYVRDVVKGKIKLTDSLVYKIMDRNKEWKDMVIVGDLTGSMSPYAGQLLVWYQLKHKERSVKSFIFFNDGDLKPDYKKEIGKTGGIYSVKAGSIDEVLNKATQTIMNGSGGDIPENNLEALLYAQKRNPDCESLIMVADNYATPRDMILLDSITKPVNVIVCGVLDTINIAYLNIAYRTGGSIHTMEKDLKDLIKLNEGEIIEINKVRYKIVDKKFVTMMEG